MKFLDINNDIFETVSEDENRCMVLGRYTVRTENAQMILEVNQRCTFEIIEDRGK